MRVAELVELPAPGAPISAHELERIAFEGRSGLVHGIYRAAPEARLTEHTSKYVFAGVMAGGVARLGEFRASAAEEAVGEERSFLDATLARFLRACDESGTYPRELFQSIILWSEELMGLSLLREAQRCLEAGLALAPSRYPDLQAQLLSLQARLLSTLGRHAEARDLLAPLIERPYLVTRRDLVPKLLAELGRECLLEGEIEYYKRLLFRGLHRFYAGMDERRIFFRQLREIHGRTARLLLSRDVVPADKAIFLAHWLYFRLCEARPARALGAGRLGRLAVLGLVYGLNYARPETAGRARQRVANGSLRSAAPPPGQRAGQARRDILVTRAMGGIGDLLMMTPGLHALKRRHPDEEIHFAVPRQYFPVLQANPDVVLRDIEAADLDPVAFRKWVNLSDCPAERIESLTVPRVRKSRIDLFAGAMGIHRWRLRRTGRLPRYFVTPEEREAQERFFQGHGLAGRVVVGVQLHADEAYRDYPRMAQLVDELRRNLAVLVFDRGRIPGGERPNVVKIEGLPLRQAFALAAGCSAIVAPDSAFTHLAAALDIPSVALYGPIDGKVRTGHYPRCRFVDSRRRLGCVPCWRNEVIPCRLTGMRGSVCLNDIEPAEVLAALGEVMAEGDSPRKP